MSPCVLIIDNAVHRFLFEPSWHDSFPSQPEMTCLARRSSQSTVNLLLPHYSHPRSVRISFPFHIFPLDFLPDMIRPLNPVCQAVGSTARRRETTLGLHSWKDTSSLFILSVCPSTKGKYALLEAMPHVRIIGFPHKLMAFGILRFFLPINRKPNQFQPEQVLSFSHFLICSIKLYSFPRCCRFRNTSFQSISRYSCTRMLRKPAIGASLSASLRRRTPTFPNISVAP